MVFTTPAPTVSKIKLDTLVNPSVRLCQLLIDRERGKCMGTISHNNKMYYLHPFTERKRLNNGGALALDHILSNNFEAHLIRR